MYMIHWPAAQLGKYVDTYGAMQKIQQEEEGQIRSIGVCNFLEEHLATISDLTYTNPAVNQIELHPLLNQAELRAVHADRGIVTEAYSPLGVGKLLDNPTLASIAQAHGKSPAQVAIRWSIQLGNVVIPRSSNPERIKDEHRRVRLRADRRRDGLDQRARRRHAVPAGPGHLHRSLTLSPSGRCSRPRATRPPTAHRSAARIRAARRRTAPRTGTRTPCWAASSRRALVALVLIRLARHREQVGRVVGEPHPLFVGPGARAQIPRQRQRHDVVDLHRRPGLLPAHERDRRVGVRVVQRAGGDGAAGSA